MDSSAPLKDQLLESDKWLLDELGFRITFYSYSPRAMGASSVELENESLRLLFLRDRGSTRAEIAPVADPHALWELSLVLEAITDVRPRYELTLQGAAALFRENLATLTHAMGPDWPNTKRELDRRRQIWLRDAMIPKPVTLKNRLLLAQLRFRRFLPLLAFAAVVAIAVWLISR